MLRMAEEFCNNANVDAPNLGADAMAYATTDKEELRRLWHANNLKQRANQKAWKEAHRERVRELNRNWEAAHREEVNARKRVRRSAPAVKEQRAIYGAWCYQHESFEQKQKRVLKSARNNALRVGREFSITISDLDWPEFCPVLGIKLNYGAPTKGRDSWDSPSIDRTDSSKGYVPGNVVVMSWRANRIKADATVEETHLLLSYLLRTRSK